jgi:hypothetical protein
MTLKSLLILKAHLRIGNQLAQYDLIDSMEINGVKVPISGPDPVGINGAHFWRGIIQA